jgi:hypothetical protein
MQQIKPANTDEIYVFNAKDELEVHWSKSPKRPLGQAPDMPNDKSGAA